VQHDSDNDNSRDSCGNSAPPADEHAKPPTLVKPLASRGADRIIDRRRHLRALGVSCFQSIAQFRQIKLVNWLGHETPST
jgi:hypothetical protein